jgi:Uma2 family endonuclease
VWNSGVFGRSERTELIEGEIVRVTPMGSRHAWVVTRLNNALMRAGGGKFLVTSQIPVLMDNYNEPEPDICVLRNSADTSRLPNATDILLLVEVCDSSLDFDRDVKLPMYARNGVPEVWLVDCKHNEVLQFRNPTKAGYGKIVTAGIDGELKLSQVRGVSVKFQISSPSNSSPESSN